MKSHLNRFVTQNFHLKHLVKFLHEASDTLQTATNLDTTVPNSSDISESQTDLAKQQNHYVSHLAEVNKTQEITSTTDVVNDKGILLVKKGARITEDVAQKVLNHKLLKPLEEQVCFEKSLGANELQVEFDKIFSELPDLKQIHESQEFSADLQTVIKFAAKKNFLLQKLTVLSQQLPDVFKKALFSAWLSSLIAKKIGLELEDIQCAFVAGLFHDIGLLHIDPDILNKKSKLEPDEWKAIKSHVVVGYLIFSNLTKKYSRVAQAILEHHECCDGTGYPVGKLEDGLGILGQIVAMADTLQAIRLNQFTRSGMNMRDTLPFLHMNTNRHFTRVYQAVSLLIMESDLPVTLKIPYPSHKAMLDTLIERVDVLQDAIVVLMLVCELTKNLHDDVQFRKFSCVAQPVLHMINSSGLAKEDILIWLKSERLQADDENTRELVEMDLMQTELLWQLKKTVKFIDEFLAVTKLLNPMQLEHLTKLSTYLYDALATKAAH